MSLWTVLLGVGLLLAGGAFSYIVLKWRRAPKVYRAMIWLVSMSAAAGFVLTLPLTHWAEQTFWFSPRAGGSGWEHVREAIEGGCPSGGVPATEVGKALILADEHHAGDPNWVSNQAQAQLCRSGAVPPDSQLCVATFIARHALGLDLDRGDRRALIPCEEVAEFCDNGALDKVSTLCKDAYHTRNARLVGGTR